MSLREKVLEQRTQRKQDAIIEAHIRAGKSNQALEGLAVSEETESLARQMLRGNITPKEARARVLAAHGIRISAG